MMTSRHKHIDHENMIKSLILDITLLVALGFPPACINSDTISLSLFAAQCKGVF